MSSPAIPRLPTNPLPGIALTLGLASLSLLLAKAPLVQQWGWSGLTLGILGGMLAGNLLPQLSAPKWEQGIAWVRHHGLRTGIILYSFGITLQSLRELGSAAILIDALVLTSTFLLAWWCGTRLLGLERSTVILIGAGSSICGAAAVMATSPGIQGNPRQVSVAVATVLLFGTTAMLVYPLLYSPISDLLVSTMGSADKSWGIYLGSTIHEVAQVVAAASNYGPSTTDTAVLTKMFRVLLLAPFLLVLGIVRQRRALRSGEATPNQKPPRVPGFVLGFIAVILLHSIPAWPHGIDPVLRQADTLLLVMAMAALGLGTRWSAIRSAGLRPMLLGAILFAWLLVGGGLINGVVLGWLH